MYYDLNVPWNEESQLRIPQLIKLYKKCKKRMKFYEFINNLIFSVGYGAVALNHVVVAKLPKNVQIFIYYKMKIYLFLLRFIILRNVQLKKLKIN